MDFAAGSRAGQVYGVPASESSGFKVADDTPGPPIDPGSGERIVSPEGVAKARAFLVAAVPRTGRCAARRRGGVSSTENTPDAHFIVDRHPRATNVWILAAAPATASRWGRPWAR